MQWRRRFGSAWVVVWVVALATGWAVGPVAVRSQEGPAAPLEAMGTAFTYQGRLLDDGEAAGGTYDFRFGLWDAAMGGVPLGTAVTVDGVAVAGGLFSVDLDFGPGAFNGDARWLEIEVKRDADLDYSLLTPRVRLRPAPNALLAAEAGNAGTLGGQPGSFYRSASNVNAGTLGTAFYSAYADLGAEGSLDNNADVDLLTRFQADGRFVNEGQAGSVTSAMIADGTVALADLGQNGCGAGQVIKWSGTAWTCAPDSDSSTTYSAGAGLELAGGVFSVTFSGSGTSDRAARADHTHTGYWSLAGNAGTAPGTSFVGTTDSVALELKVGNARALRLEPHATSPNVVGGYSGNIVTAGVYAATVGGGGSFGMVNRVSDAFGTVSGGQANQAGDDMGSTNDRPYATVGGGQSNTASGDWGTVGGGAANTAAGRSATVAGGWQNEAGSDYASVGGGYLNSATGGSATVAGGNDNSAGGGGATVGGGWQNQAGGDYATVGGGSQITAGGDHATVAGGQSIEALGRWTVVGGGTNNAAFGQGATVPGGRNNLAGGDYSFAAGYRAKANAAGCFVWADTTEADFACATANQFAARATGGVSLLVDTGGGGLRVQPNATSPNLIAGYAGNTVAAGTAAATVSGGGLAGAINQVTSSYGTVGGGRGNTAGGSSSTVSGGNGNSAGGSSATVAGGSGNQAGAGSAAIGGGGDNIVTDDYGTIGGGLGNQAGDNAGSTGDMGYATVGGGHANTAGWGLSTVSGGGSNAAGGSGATVGGGVLNIASTQHATIGGGYDNAVTDDYGTIGGGGGNQAGDYYGTTADASYAAVGGGNGNTAEGSYSTVGGGYNNRAAGDYATVPGGYDNLALGAYSFAAGRHAEASAAGAFVWGDSNEGLVMTVTPNQWKARASGGVYFYTNSTMTSGTYVAAGSSSWSMVSDRNLKDNVRPVDGREVLARLAEVPIATWNYESQDPSIRHMGPMAQDFYAAFAVGEDNKHIAAVDADGVALAAIQGLYAENQALKATAAAQQAQIDDLEARLSALEGQGAGRRGAGESARELLAGTGPWLLAGGLVLAGCVAAGTRKGGRR